MNRWDFDEYIPQKKDKKRKSREEFLKNFVQCDVCGYRNKKEFLQRKGECNCCGKILDPRAHMKYVVNKKIKNYKKH